MHDGGWFVCESFDVASSFFSLTGVGTFLKQTHINLRRRAQDPSQLAVRMDGQGGWGKVAV
jgi:hypothetical protein